MVELVLLGTTSSFGTIYDNDDDDDDDDDDDHTALMGLITFEQSRRRNDQVN